MKTDATRKRQIIKRLLALSWLCTSISLGTSYYKQRQEEQHKAQFKIAEQKVDASIERVRIKQRQLEAKTKALKASGNWTAAQITILQRESDEIDRELRQTQAEWNQLRTR